MQINGPFLERNSERCTKFRHSETLASGLPAIRELADLPAFCLLSSAASQIWPSLGRYTDWVCAGQEAITHRASPRSSSFHRDVFLRHSVGPCVSYDPGYSIQPGMASLLDRTQRRLYVGCVSGGI